MSDQLTKRVESLLRPVFYIYNAAFDDAAQVDAILGPLPGEVEPPAPVDNSQGDLVVTLCSHGLLTAEQEVHLFRQMNFLKHRLVGLQAALKQQPLVALVEAAERCKRQAESVRNFIIEHNQRMVYSISCKYLRPDKTLGGLMSDGNMALMRAVEKFDYALGNKFSTYAQYAVQREFWKKNRVREINGIEDLEDVRATRRWKRSDQVLPAETEGRDSRIAELVKGLNAREKVVLAERIMADADEKKTLDQLARRWGITRERVRQIEAKLLLKLRQRANEAGGEDYFLD
jgi:RNA polymerase sigma factor (sigma-70 family)